MALPYKSTPLQQVLLAYSACAIFFSVALAAVLLNPLKLTSRKTAVSLSMIILIIHAVTLYAVTMFSLYRLCSFGDKKFKVKEHCFQVASVFWNKTKMDEKLDFLHARVESVFDFVEAVPNLLMHICICCWSKEETEDAFENMGDCMHALLACICCCCKHKEETSDIQEEGHRYQSVSVNYT